MNIAYVLNPSKSITAVLSGGKALTINNSHKHFDRVVALLTKGYSDNNYIEELMKPIVQLSHTVNNDTSGILSFSGSTVVATINGYNFPLAHSLTLEILRVKNAEGNITPFTNFVRKLANNPDRDVHQQLFGFIQECGLTLTEDGNFLAYKIVRSDFKDIYSGTMDNSPGKEVSMERFAVEKDPFKTCSQGLHFAAWSYLGHYGRLNGGDKVVLLSIDPADVVSIPVDYNNAKGRAWRYKVLREVERPEELKDISVYRDSDDFDDYDYEEYIEESEEENGLTFDEFDDMLFWLDDNRTKRLVNEEGVSYWMRSHGTTVYTRNNAQSIRYKADMDFMYDDWENTTVWTVETN